METTQAQRQLDLFIGKYSPEVDLIAHATLERLRELIPGAVSLVYDNYNALAIGFGYGERVSDVILSVVLYPRYVSICFMHGADLPDPDGILRGAGKQVRNVILSGAADLDRPAVRTLIDRAVAGSANPPIPGDQNRIVVKSVSKVQRPRRPSQSKQVPGAPDRDEALAKGRDDAA